MQLVNTWDEIKENIKTLEKYRTLRNPRIKTFYKNLIEKGICFIAYQIEQQIHFAPSRFIGYSGNNIDLHNGNENRHGSYTNKAIKRILNDIPMLNSRLDFEYRKFCRQIGFTANVTGSFDKPRKFWFSQEKTELLNEILNSSTNDKELLEDLKDVENQMDIESTEKQRLVSARIGQGWFREKLISLWKGCAVTECNEITILRASHIKPWRYSSNEERLDVYNGLLLIPNLDVLFDKGFISFKENGEIIISKIIKNENIVRLGVNANMKITTQSNHVPYLKWHSKNIFRN